MSETKFTKGPWRAEDKAAFSIETNARAVVDGGRYPVAFCPAWDVAEPDAPAAVEEGRANAALISSAPELYEALDALLDAATAEVNEKGGGGFILARMSDAREVLRKSRGESGSAGK